MQRENSEIKPDTMLPSPPLSDCSAKEDALLPLMKVDPAKPSRATQKRNCGEISSAAIKCTDFGQEMTDTLQAFGTDVTNALKMKKRRINQLMSGTIENLRSKFDQNRCDAAEKNNNIIQEMLSKSASIMQKWDIDIANMKEQQDKITKCFVQQNKLFHQTRTALSEKLHAFRQNLEAFSKSIEEQREQNNKEANEVKSNLKKELQVLQKKMIKDGEREEMERMKTALNNMLSM